MKKGLRYGLLGLLLLLIAGVGAPFIRVDQYREQIASDSNENSTAKSRSTATPI